MQIHIDFTANWFSCLRRSFLRHFFFGSPNVHLSCAVNHAINYNGNKWLRKYTQTSIHARKHCALSNSKPNRIATNQWDQIKHRINFNVDDTQTDADVGGFCCRREIWNLCITRKSIINEISIKTEQRVFLSHNANQYLDKPFNWRNFRENPQNLSLQKCKMKMWNDVKAHHHANNIDATFRHEPCSSCGWGVFVCI